MAERTRQPARYYQPPIRIPKIAKAAYEGKFNASLVERGRMNYHPSSEPSPLPFATLASGSSRTPLEKPSATPIPAANGYSKEVTKSESIPWYRTTKGQAIIIVGTLVVVAIIVGVAVGVTKGSNNRSENSVLDRGPDGVSTTATTNTTAITIAAATTATAATTTRTATTTTAATITVAATTTAAATITVALGPPVEAISRATTTHIVSATVL